MKELLERIEEIESKTSILEPDTKTRAQYHQLILEFADQFINHIDEGRAFQKLEGALKGLDIDGQKNEFKALIDVYQKQVLPYGINPASGGHIGYIPGGGIYASALADYIADVSNEYAGMYFGSPGAVTIENECIEWTRKLFGFPERTIGNICSGGSIANLIALTAARDRHKVKEEKIGQAVIYMSEQVHHCIHKALRIIGLGDIMIRHIALDDRSRMIPEHLKAQIQKDKIAGFTPFLIVASAGTTDTGAIDPMDDIADIAEREQMWFHVDGAYGGFFILVDEKKSLFKGIERADSLVVDPHKSLFLPYGTGIVLVKDLEAVMHSHHYVANYMQDAYDESLPINPADVSPELTKHFRGLRLWFPLKMYGYEVFADGLREKLLLTVYFRQRLEEIGFKLGPKPDLSVSYFWFPHKDEDAFNRRLLHHIHRDGRVFLSSSIIQGRFVIRMAILAFRTKRKTIDVAMNMITKALDRTRLEMEL